MANREQLLRFPASPECHAALAFDRGDGVVLGLDQPGGLLDDHGRAWVATARGLVSFEPREVHARTPRAQLRIHSLLADGLELQPEDGTLVLPPGERAFAVRLEASLAPLHAETRFQYRLPPSTQWLDCGDRLPFAQLPPGRFELETRAAFGSGIWSESAWLEVELTPYPWERTSVRLALAAGSAVLLATLALTLHRRRLHGVAQRAREALELAQERARAAETLRLVTESVPAQLVSVGPDRRILWCNGRFLREWGIPAADGAARTFEALVGEGAGELTRLLECALGGRAAQGSVVPSTGRHLDVAFVPQRDLDGTLLGVIGLLVDTSERHELEARLQQAQRLEALGTFAGGIAHDFNNLLAVILGRTELALLDLADPRAAKEHLDEVLLSGLRARDLVARILTFGRRGSGAGDPCDLARATAETLRRMRSSLPAGVTLRSALEPESWARLDEIQGQQVVSNLTSNALLALEGRSGTVEVRVERRGEDEVELLVRDDGCGMSPEVQARIFEPFFSTRAVGSGTGLGLSVVHGVVRECGGSIEVESSPGKGTTFRVRLPALPHPAPEIALTVTPVAPPREPALTP